MINNKNTIITLFIFLVLIGCKNDTEKEVTENNNPEKISLSDTTTNIELESNQNEKTRVLTESQILFFMPSPKEKQELIKFYGYYNQYELQSVFSDFSSMAASTKSSAKRYKLKMEITYAKKFVFPLENDTIIYDLDAEKQIMGYILFDGTNEPLIKNGVQKYKVVSDDIKQYFKLSKFYMFEEKNDQPTTASKQTNTPDTLNKLNNNN